MAKLKYSFNDPAHWGHLLPSEFDAKVRFIERYVAEMSRDERLVEGGMCYLYYILGALTNDELDVLLGMLGFSDEEWDRVCL